MICEEDFKLRASEIPGVKSANIRPNGHWQIKCIRKLTINYYPQSYNKTVYYKKGEERGITIKENYTVNDVVSLTKELIDAGRTSKLQERLEDHSKLREGVSQVC